MGEWLVPEFAWVGLRGVIRAPMAFVVVPPAIPIARRRGRNQLSGFAGELRDQEGRSVTGENVMSVEWKHIGEAEWQASIGGRMYSVFRRPCPPKGEPAWAWLSLDPKRRSAHGMASSFDEAKRMAELDGAKIDEKA